MLIVVSFFRHLRINALLPSRPISTKTFYAILSSYVNVTSLSLCTSDPAQICAYLPTLSFAPTLRRLDLRCAPGRALEFWDIVEVRLPKLEELRLGASEYLAADEGRYNSPRGERMRVPGTVEFAVCAYSFHSNLLPALIQNRLPFSFLFLKY